MRLNQTDESRMNRMKAELGKIGKTQKQICEEKATEHRKLMGRGEEKGKEAGKSARISKSGDEKGGRGRYRYTQHNRRETR